MNFRTELFVCLIAVVPVVSGIAGLVYAWGME